MVSFFIDVRKHIFGGFMNMRDWIESTKITFQPAWIRRWDEDPFSVPPVYLELSPAGACNQRCTFCAPEVLGYKTTYLNADILAERFYEMQEMRKADPDKLGVRNFHIAGDGEPTLHPRLDTICGSARSVGISIGILTNGVPLTEKRIYALLPHVDLYLQFSVNAGTEASYALIHQTDPKDWKRVWQNIKRVVAIKKELGSPCSLGANMTILMKSAALADGTTIPANFKEMDLLTQLAQDAGLDYVCFKPYSQHPYSRETMKLYGDTDYTPFMDVMYEKNDELRRNYETNDFAVIFRIKRFREYDDERGYRRCVATPTLWGYIQSNGTFISCSAHWTNPDFHLGNIHTQTFKEIWFGERRRQHLEWMKNFDISVCRKGCQPDQDNKFLARFQELPHREKERALATLAALPPLH
jgi:MoaA/NifB/PqqE/SkfB family radical SAM enzyme